MICLRAVGRIKCIPKCLCRWHHHGGRAVYLAAICSDTVVTHTQVDQPTVPGLYVSLKIDPQNLPLCLIKVHHKEAGHLGVVYIRVVLLVEAIDARTPDPAIIDPPCFGCETQVAASSDITAPTIKRWCRPQPIISHSMIKLATESSKRPIQLTTAIVGVAHVIEVTFNIFDVHRECWCSGITGIMVAIVELKGVVPRSKAIADIVALPRVLCG